ncbi:MAG: response regulator [Proteobacteria bacterium]|nr:response regulator [Desulfobacula sp.]MBU3951909.1 response regulator [Pseudomonadota bacterium]MBU4132472.1 response regulator [Pseudomonadota bacterium]
MDHQDILKDKRILLVDDEPDVLETLEELLYICKTDSATSFESAVLCLKNNTYDAAILDIMGVEGYSLLKITHGLDIPAIMLTAHALTPDSLKRSIEQGADAYVPKDKLVDISLFVADVLSARQQGKNAHSTWFAMLNPLFDKLFGKGWRTNDQKFWDKFDK